MNLLKIKKSLSKLSALLAVVAVAAFAWNCEKDDICDQATSTTPRLILHFYDAANPTAEKNVTNLQATAVASAADPLNFDGKSQIELPLNTTEDSTTYTLTLNSTNTALDNQEVLTFNYSRNELFVSRACGYKVVFSLDPATPLVHTDAVPADGLWMQTVQVTQPNVQNENEVHVSIYF